MSIKTTNAAATAIAAARHAPRTNDEHCPHCGVSLQGEPIPPEEQHHFGATHFGRQIGHTDWDKDMVVEWSCPDCKGVWERT